MKKILFSGKDVEVRYNGEIKNKYNIIVFRCAGNLPLILKDGTRIEPTWPYFMNFEDFFVTDEINEIYVDAFNQHSYEVAEMKEAIQSIKKIIPPDSKNITFGLSMGAFGAVNFSRDLNAIFIAISPSATFSGFLPISKRMKIYSDSYKLGPSKIEQGFCKECFGYVFYDYYFTIDRIHAYYIRNNTKAKIFNNPFWGHSNAHKLNECFKIKEIVCEIFNNTFDLSMIKKRMHDFYFKSSHVNYIIFLINNFYKKKINKNLKEYLKNKIDLKNIIHLQMISEYLLKINKRQEALGFAKEAYKINSKNKKTQDIIIKCIDLNNEKLEKKDLEIYEEWKASSLFYSGKIKEAESIFSKLNKFYEMSSFYEYAICLELLDKNIQCCKVLNNALNICSNDSTINKYLQCHKARITNFIYGPHLNLLNSYIFINNNMYKIVLPNYNEGLNGCYSFINIKNSKYLRHQNGKLIESNKIDTLLFKFDSSFIVYNNFNNKISLRCSNLNLTNLFVFNCNYEFIIKEFSKNNLAPYEFDVFCRI